MWQTEPFTQQIVKQLQLEPKVFVSTINDQESCRSETDHNVPDLSNIGSYVECTTNEDIYVNEEKKPSPKTDHERSNSIEEELSKMFQNEVQPPIFTIKPKIKKRLSVRKKNLRQLWRLFGSPSVSDLGIDTKSKKITEKLKNITGRRHTLPVSINLPDCDFLKPLKVSQKRKSETDVATATSSKLQRRVPVTASCEELNVDLTSVSDLVIPTIFKEVARVVCSGRLERNFTVCESPEVFSSDTIMAATQETAPVIDLTRDDTFEDGSSVMSFNGIRVEIKADSEQAHVPLSAHLSMPLLSPTVPSVATNTEAVLPQALVRPEPVKATTTQRPPPTRKQKTKENGGQQTKKARLLRPKYDEPQPLPPSLFIRQSSELFQNNNQACARNSDFGLAQNTKEQNRSSGFPILPNIQVHQNLAALQQNRQNPIGLQREHPNLQNQQNLAKGAPNRSTIQIHQNITLGFRNQGPQNRLEDSALAAHMRQLQSLTSSIGMNQQNVVSGNSLQAQHRMQKAQQTAQQVPSSNSYGMQQILQPAQQKPPSHNQYALQSAVSCQRHMPSPNSYPNQKPSSQQNPEQYPQMRLLMEFSLVSNAACAERIFPHLFNFINYLIAVNKFVKDTKPLFTETEQKIETQKFKTYSNSTVLVFTRRLLRDLMFIEVDKFTLRDVIFHLEEKFNENQARMSTLTICSHLHMMIKDLPYQFNTPFLKKFFDDVKLSATSCEKRMEQVSAKISHQQLRKVSHEQLPTISREQLSTASHQQFPTVSHQQLPTISHEQLPKLSHQQLQILDVQIRQFVLINNWLSTNLTKEQAPPPPYPQAINKEVPKKPVPQRRRSTIETEKLLAQMNAFVSSAIPSQNAGCDRNPTSPVQSSTIGQAQASSERLSVILPPAVTHTVSSMVPPPAITISNAASTIVPPPTISHTVSSMVPPPATVRNNTASTTVPPPAISHTVPPSSTPKMDIPPPTSAETGISVCPVRNEEVKTEDEKKLHTEVNEEFKPKMAAAFDDEVIDLTWINECDEQDIIDDVMDCKSFPLKIESYADDSDRSPDREVTSPADSGLGSPRIVEQDNGHFRCLCGNGAIYICSCNSSMYCSKECQVSDWGDHQSLCNKMKQLQKQ